MAALVSGLRLLLLLALPASAGAPAGAAPPGPPSIEAVVRIVTGPSPVDRFSRPAALWIDRERGIVLVADRGGRRIVLFDDGGRCRGALPFPGGEPRSLAADSHGRLYVADALDPDVRVLTARGFPLGRLQLPLDPEDRAATRPQSVAVGASDRIYVLYGGRRNGLAVFDRRGRLRPDLGVPPEREAFSSPVSLAVSPDESLLAVVDPLAERQVRLLRPDGQPVAEFGPHGEGEGTFSLAGDATWAPGGTLWVTDTLRHSVSVFDAGGRPLGRIGGFGRAPGQFLYPVACGFTGPDRLIVLERGGARYQVLDVRAPRSSGGSVSALPRTRLVNPKA